MREREAGGVRDLRGMCVDEPAGFPTVKFSCIRTNRVQTDEHKQLLVPLSSAAPDP